MAFQTCWLIHGRIAYTQIIDVYTQDDFNRSMDELETMFAQAIPLTHFITDGTLMTESELGLKELLHQRLPKAPGLGWSLFVDPRKINRFFAGATAHETLPDLSQVQPVFENR
jgi:hypothetical protein